jgi:hypothetical protein
MAAQYTARLVQDPCHQRAFQGDGEGTDVTWVGRQGLEPGPTD